MSLKKAIYMLGAFCLMSVPTTADDQGLEYKDVLNPMTGRIAYTIPLPSSWEVKHDPNKTYFISGPNGEKIYNSYSNNYYFGSGNVDFSHIFPNRQRFSPMETSNYFHQIVKPHLKSQDFELLKSYPIPEYVELMNKFSVGMPETGVTRKHCAIGSDWQSAAGERSMVTTVISYYQLQGSVMWNVLMTQMEAPDQYFAVAKEHVKFGVANSRVGVRNHNHAINKMENFLRERDKLLDSKPPGSSIDSDRVYRYIPESKHHYDWAKHLDKPDPDTNPQTIWDPPPTANGPEFELSTIIGNYCEGIIPDQTALNHKLPTPANEPKPAEDPNDIPITSLAKNLEIKEINDTSTSKVIYNLPMPTGWQMMSNSDLPFLMSGPNGEIIYEPTKKQYVERSRRTMADADMGGRGQMYAMTAERYLDRFVSSDLRAQGYEFLRSYPLPEFVGFKKRRAAVSPSSRYSETFYVIGSDWQMPNGHRAMVVTEVSQYLGAGNIVWDADITKITAPAANFESAKNAIRYGISQAQPGLKE